MTHMLRKHQNEQHKIPPTAVHRDSRVISKIQPKIRIIHIFAPEIIQTDVANFRELVQRLTGKPSPSTDAYKASKLPVEAISNNMAAGDRDQSYSHHYKPVVNVNGNGNVNVNVSNKDFVGSYDDHRENGGFLEVFDGVNDYFMQDMGDFSLIPMEGNDSLQPHHLFGDTFHSLSYRG